MNKKITEKIASHKVSLIVMLLYASGLAVATFVEKGAGTESAKIYFYYSPLFFLLPLFLVLNFFITEKKKPLRRKKGPGFMLVHIAFVIILAGALVTHFFGKEGMLHIREGESVNRMLIRSDKGDTYYSLPFSLTLEKFILVRYPGSTAPSSYESFLTVDVDGLSLNETVSMNNVLDIKGYRLFQASYDTDEKGTILSVNRDVAGRNVTYTGYITLIAGFILCLTGKGSRFRQLSNRLKQIRTVGIGMLLLIPFSALTAQNDSGKKLFEVIQKNKVSKEHAAKFGTLPMQSADGRIKPVNTFSSEVLRKLHKSDRIGELNPDQFLLSVLAMPEMWMEVPVIILKDREISFHFDITEGVFAYSELFDSNGNYKLQAELETAFAKPLSARTRFDKELIKLDEKANVFHQLLNFRMINLFPDRRDPNHKWYAPGDDLSAFDRSDSVRIRQITAEYMVGLRRALRTGDWRDANSRVEEIREFQQERTNRLDGEEKKIEMELVYNRWNIFGKCKVCFLVLGGVLLILSFTSLFNKQKYMAFLIRVLMGTVFVVTLFLLFGMGLRWYIAGYAPWSNGYETMIYVSFITVAGGFIFLRQSSITFSLAVLFTGIILFVAGLNWMDPHISPLVPVLKSFWLMIHVAVIVAAYGFFGIGFLLGTTNIILLLINKKGRSETIGLRIKELTVINEMALWIGLALMATGTFIGAVWANQSWGRYWGWDPKETWALITILIYAVVTHMHLVKKWDTPFRFNLGSVLAFGCVLMTYFGVNYLLTGMHSYA